MGANGMKVPPGQDLASPPNPNPPRHPHRWKWALAGLLVVAFLAWQMRDRWTHAQFQWATFAASFSGLRWGWLAGALAAALSTYYGRALRWRVMLKPLRPEASIWSLFKATAIGFTAVVALGRPGEFVRPYLISVKERVPFSSQVAAWILERIFDLLAVLLLFGFAVSQIRTSHANLGPALRWALQTGGYVVAGLGIVCVILLVMMGRFSDVVRRRISAALDVLPSRFHARAERMLHAFLDGTAATKSHTCTLQLTFYTLLEWTLIVLCFVCIFNAYEQTGMFRLQDVLIFIGFVAFGSVIQIPGVGGGMQLISILVLTQLYGIRLEVATGIAIMMWLVTFVAIVPPGVLFTFHEGLNWRKLKELERNAVCAESALAEAGEAGGLER